MTYIMYFIPHDIHKSHILQSINRIEHQLVIEDVPLAQQQRFSLHFSTKHTILDIYSFHGLLGSSNHSGNQQKWLLTCAYPNLNQ